MQVNVTAYCSEVLLHVNVTACCSEVFVGASLRRGIISIFCSEFVDAIIFVIWVTYAEITKTGCAARDRSD